jgi:hypothetical protein
MTGANNSFLFSCPQFIVRFDKIIMRIDAQLTNAKTKIEPKIPKLQRVAWKLGNASLAMNTTAEYAETSNTVVTIAKACLDATATQLDDIAYLDLMKNVPVDPGIRTIRQAAKFCPAAIQRIVDEIPSFDVLDKMNELLKEIFSALDPVIEKFEKILAAVASEATEVLCCGLSPHLQGMMTALTQIVDTSTCFADGLVGELEDFLLSLVPNLESFSFDAFTLVGLEVSNARPPTSGSQNPNPF